MDASGLATFNNNVSIKQRLDVSNVVINENVTANGNTSLYTMDASGLATFNDNVVINSTLDVSNVVIHENVTTNGNTSLYTMDASGLATFNDIVVINSRLDVSNVYINNDLTVKGLINLQTVEVSNINITGIINNALFDNITYKNMIASSQFNITNNVVNVSGIDISYALDLSYDWSDLITDISWGTFNGLNGLINKLNKFPSKYEYNLWNSNNMLMTTTTLVVENVSKNKKKIKFTVNDNIVQEGEIIQKPVYLNSSDNLQQKFNNIYNIDVSLSLQDLLPNFSNFFAADPDADPDAAAAAINAITYLESNLNPFYKWWHKSDNNIIKEDNSWNAPSQLSKSPLNYQEKIVIADISNRFFNINKLNDFKNTPLFGIGFEWSELLFDDSSKNSLDTYVIDNLNQQSSSNSIGVEKIKPGLAGVIAFDNSNSHITNNFLSFTGQHRNKLVIPYKVYLIGLIVESTGKYLNLDGSKIPSINEALPYVCPTTKAKSKSVFGVISNEEDETDGKRVSSFGIFTNIYDKKEPSTRTFINSIGEGSIWIVNTNGNLENGDYIQSSNIMGHGEKQDDDILHNYTVAKITCGCDFNLDSEDYLCFEHENDDGLLYRKAFVGCTYHCG